MFLSHIHIIRIFQLTYSILNTFRNLLQYLYHLAIKCEPDIFIVDITFYFGNHELYWLGLLNINNKCVCCSLRVQFLPPVL